MVCSGAYPDAPLCPTFSTGASSEVFLAASAGATSARSAISVASPTASRPTAMDLPPTHAAVVCSLCMVTSSRVSLQLVLDRSGPRPSCPLGPLRPVSSAQLPVLDPERDHARHLAGAEVVVALEHERAPPAGQARPERQALVVVQQRVRLRPRRRGARRRAAGEVHQQLLLYRLEARRREARIARDVLGAVEGDPVDAHRVADA